MCHQIDRLNLEIQIIDLQLQRWQTLDFVTGDHVGIVVIIVPGTVFLKQPVLKSLLLHLFLTLAIS